MSFNPPPAAAGTQAIPNPNTTTTTTSLPSPSNNIISPTQSDHAILSLNPSHDLESDNQPSPITNLNNTDIELPEGQYIGKAAKTVGFGGFMTLFVDNPGSATTHPALKIGYRTFVCLGLACCLWLSIIKSGSPTTGMIKKKLIYLTLLFVVLACFFRLQIALPLVHLGFVIVLVLIGLLFIVLYLLLSSRCQRQIK